ncbi:MAG: caspase family protein [Saprospiraceae bacterium]|nr:caspase family protein [Saprospiraceae bacterium]
MPDPSDIRGLEVDEYSALPPRRRRNRLLLIGIDEYRHLPALEHPVRDCERLFEVLREHYGFNEEDLIKSLFNAEATRQLMYDELYRLRATMANLFFLPTIISYWFSLATATSTSAAAEAIGCR